MNFYHDQCFVWIDVGMDLKSMINHNITDSTNKQFAPWDCSLPVMHAPYLEDDAVLNMRGLDWLIFVSIPTSPAFLLFTPSANLP